MLLLFYQIILHLPSFHFYLIENFIRQQVKYNHEAQRPHLVY